MVPANREPAMVPYNTLGSLNGPLKESNNSTMTDWYGDYKANLVIECC